jgi:hypothetical protein
MSRSGVPSRNTSYRPHSSLSEHVAREIQRDYPNYLSNHTPRHGPISYGARGIKRMVFATAGGVKQVYIATGRKGAKLGGTLKRSMSNFIKRPENDSIRPGDMLHSCTFTLYKLD